MSTLSNVTHWIGRVSSVLDDEYRGRIKVLILGHSNFNATNNQPDQYLDQKSEEGNNILRGDGYNSSSSGQNTNLNNLTPDQAQALIEQNQKNNVGDGSWINPVPGDGVVITSGSGYRNVSGGTRDHGGIDIRAAEGSPILAAANGTVIQAQPYTDGNGGGSRITIKHNDGTYSTKYMHLQTIGVKVGDTVAAGQQIGTAGSSGNGKASGAFGAHLHYEVLENDQRVIPDSFLSNFSYKSGANTSKTSERVTNSVNNPSSVSAGGTGSSAYQPVGTDANSNGNSLYSDAQNAPGVWAVCSYPITYGGIPKKGTLPAPSVQVGAIVHGISLDGDMMQELIVLGIVPRYEAVDKLSRNETGSSATSAFGGKFTGGNNPGVSGASSDPTLAVGSTNDLLNSTFCGQFSVGDYSKAKLDVESNSGGNLNKVGDNWEYGSSKTYAAKPGSTIGSEFQISRAAGIDGLNYLINNGDEETSNALLEKITGVSNLSSTLTKEKWNEIITSNDAVSNQILLAASTAYTAMQNNSIGRSSGNTPGDGLIKAYAYLHPASAKATAAWFSQNPGASASEILAKADEIYLSYPNTAGNGLPSAYVARVASSLGTDVDGLLKACKGMN